MSTELTKPSCLLREPRLQPSVVIAAETTWYPLHFRRECIFHRSDGSILGEAIERRGLWVVNASAADVNSDDPLNYFANIPERSLQQ